MVKYERKPLDSSLYFLEPDVARLFKASTGIQNDKALKTHILKVQEEAYRSFPYPCIRLFSFTRMTVPELPSYKEILKIGKERDDAILLEIGSGFGNDIRKLVDDGFPATKVVASDINAELWELGHNLFRSNSDTFPVKFVEADIFDETTLSSKPTLPSFRPDLRMLRTLTPLKGHVSTIVLQMVFHLFDEKRQLELARRVAQLLSPAPGSLIVGRQMGDVRPRDIPLEGNPHFVHNERSWEKMWSRVFPKGTVEYRTELRDLPQDLIAATLDMVDVSQFLNWSIRRL